MKKMIDCSKTENYFNEKLRMTKKTKKGLCKTKCSDCPLCSDNNGTSEGLSCGCFEMFYPEQAIEAVQRWSNAHPPKTYLSELLKIFPNIPLGDDDMPETICPHHLGLKDIKDCEIDPNCVECWNQPVGGR
jgi:hypothetical protein|nr:MAG: hypothetical protein [Bacteriophage sp.]